MNDFDPTQSKILLATEDLKLQDFITLILMGEGYNIKAFFNQDDLSQELKKEPVDLIIIDFLSPKINGLEFCKTIRENFTSKYTPVLLIVPEETPLLKTKAIFTGANDFIEKPFSSEELLARTKASLLRAQRYQDTNPLTKLPGMSTTVKELNIRIESKEQFGAAYCDLGSLRRYNERYGFKQGDQLLKYIAKLLTHSLKSLGNPSDFLAHIGSDDFFFITCADGIEPICKKIINDFEQTITDFYNDEDKKQGYAIIKNRKGEVSKIPLLRMHIGAVTNEFFPFVSAAMVLQITTELKNHAKKFQKSTYIKERRKSYPFC
ncbi:MAG: response regulator [Candidatus Omnitrophica bacterium]|nr:response regulator [Candidatus Omnitrophota bacterium]